MLFRKKPIVIEALKFNGDNFEQIDKFVRQKAHLVKRYGEPVLLIATLEGEMPANSGDWIIKSVKGELYPCKPDIFEQTYEPVAGNCIGGEVINE